MTRPPAGRADLRLQRVLSHLSDRRTYLYRQDRSGRRPILWHNRTGTCWHPYVKGYTLMVNSVYNGWRMEDVWLDK